MDKDKSPKTDLIIYHYELEVAYWDRYIVGLVDFINSKKLSKKKLLSIQDEIFRVHKHKEKLADEIEFYLKNEGKLNVEISKKYINMEQSKQIAKTPQQTLISQFSSTISKYEKNNLAELLATHNVSPSQFKQIVINEVKKSEAMQKAFKVNPSSLFASILLCAELGLNPSADVGEFYFIPYGNKITPILGYKGVINLLLRSGEIAKLWAEIVYSEDEFEYELGLEPKLSHIPNHERQSNNIKCVYAVAKLNNGETTFKVMSKKEIMEIVEMSKYPNELYTNHKKDPQGWMYKKTVIKQLAKTLPKDYYGKKGISIDDKSESGSYLRLDDDNNIIVVDGKKVPPKRSKSVYSNLNIEEPIDVDSIEVTDAEIIEPQKNISKNKKDKNKSLTLDLETDTSVS